MSMFLCRIPIPPSRAIAIAISDSVTVSIAALTSGMFNRMFLLKRVRTSVSRGRTDDLAGTRRTSSNVSASRIVFCFGKGSFLLLLYTNA
jgi:hypothetical protein